MTQGSRGADMPPEEFRRHAEAVVEWITEYLDSVGEYPVLPMVEPGFLKDELPRSAPETGEPMVEVLGDFREKIVPGITHWNHPAFHGYFAVTGSAPGILGEMLTAALNVNAMVWRSSPSGTELEELVLDWIRQLLGLPAGFEGTINDTASSSSLFALAAAREKHLPEAREEGLTAAPRARIYASEEAHSSIGKAAITLGLGRKGLRTVEADQDFQMKPEALRAAIEDDLSQGVRPIAVVATVGTTSTASVDPVDAIADIAEEYGLWLHVDAAYAGTSAMVPEMRSHFAGWERAQSVVFNPHKWLFTPVDCSVLYCREPQTLKAAFSLVPEYLRTAEEAVAKNLMDYGVALGRRFRALKLWFVVRYFGAEGIRERIRRHIELAREFADWIDGSRAWERMAPVHFSTVAFRFAPEGATPEEQDRWTEQIMERVNASGEAFLSHTRLHGRMSIRLSIGNLRTDSKRMQRTWEVIRREAEKVAGATTG